MIYEERIILRIKTNIDHIIWILTVLLLASFVILELNGGAAALFAISAVTLLLVMKKNHGKIKVDYYQIMVTIFAIYCCMTSLWANNSGRSIEAGLAIIKIIICLTVYYTYYCKEESIDRLLNAVMWSGYIVVIYAWIFYGPSMVVEILTGGGKLENSFANINTTAMTASTSIMLSFFLMFKEKKKRTVLIVFDILSIMVVAASGSRKALVLAVIGVTAVILINNASKSLIKTVVKWIGIGIVLLVSFRILLSLPAFSMVNQRMEGLFAMILGHGEVDHSSFLRQSYIRVGIEQFKKSPWLGFGMDNTYLITSVVEGNRTYLHNNYVELLAGGGVTALLLFYSIYIYLLFEFLKDWKTGDIYSRLCIIWMGILLIMHYGAVVYYDKTSYFYMMIFFLQTNIIKKHKEMERMKNACIREG